MVFGNNTYGYGMRFDNVEYKDNAATIFFDEFASKIKYIKETYETFCEDNNLNPEDNDSKEEFVDMYESEINTWSGLESLISDTINIQMYGDVCSYYNTEDYCIFVEPYILHENDKMNSVPTIESIGETLAKYMNPILRDPVKLEWLEIER